MGYIIAGANLSNTERPTVAEKADTALNALRTINDLQSSGYKVRVSSSEGEDVTIEHIKFRASGEVLSFTQDHSKLAT